MLRNLLTLIPAIAFALPFVAAQSSMARPLANEATPTEWCWGGGDCGGGGDQQVFLQVCTQTIIEVNTGGDDRAYKCELQTGPACLSNCTEDAVALTGESVDTCRAQCDDGGAAFCAPKGLQARWGDGWGFDQDDDDDFDHDHGGDDQQIFVNTETCLQLDLDQDNR